MAVLVGWESAPSAPLGPDPRGGAPGQVGDLLPFPARPTVEPAAAPAGPRPPRRQPRVRRPVEPAPAPVHRPAVSSCEETYARRRFVALLVVGLVAAATVIGLALLGSAATDDGVPDRTAITEVAPGETLWDIAHRVAPESPQQAVVDRIRQLNGMQGSTLHPGQPLVVPAG